MFRYGGPIKEGVMHGMRNNYQSGQLVRPGPGRPGYQGNPYSTNYNLIDWKNANRPYRPLNITNISEVGSGTSNATKIQRAKNLLKSSKFSERGFYEAAKKYIPKALSGIKSGVGWGLKRFPLVTLGAAGEIITRPREIDKLVYEQEGYGPWEGRFRKTLDPTYLKKWMKAASQYNKDKKLAKDKITTDKIIPSDKPEHLGLEPYTDPDKAKKLAKEQQNKRLKSYLDMMGYDSAKKTAMSDALIDASALVQDASTEAGSIKHADWGKLINKAIQTTSKRLDKPAQIREAVGLMMTKGAIEKDIAEGKDSAYDKQIESIAANLNISKKVAQKMVLNKPTSLREQVTYDVGVSKQNLTHDSLTSAVKKWYPDAIPLMNTTEVKKELGDQSAEDFIIDKIKADPPGGEGIYIVGKEVVKVDGTGNTSTIFP